MNPASYSKRHLFSIMQSSRRLLILLLLLAASVALQASPSWEFHLNKTGNVLLEGGWSLEYRLGVINASPEFSFPLQLVYQSTKETKGLFGNQWFCPQLESKLVPKGAGFLIWTMPSGGQAGLKISSTRADQFISPDGEWSATRAGVTFTISNSEGWIYTYDKGVLLSIQSPTGRRLEVQGYGTEQLTLLLHDPLSGAQRILLTLGLGKTQCVSALQINGQMQQFSYTTDGASERLIGWAPPLGNSLRFSYLPESGILARVESFESQKVIDTTDFATFFVPTAPPAEGEETLSPSVQVPQRDPANYWLKSDSFADYEYIPDPKNKDHFLSGQVKGKSKSGAILQSSLSQRGGVMTTQVGSEKKLTYFYVAPGQKYNGKLRRIEVGSAVVAEYFYDRKSGLLKEIWDSNGQGTFLEYPTAWHPAKAPGAEPKPSRILHGILGHKELQAELLYDDSARVIQSKDALGQTTTYAYSPRGEIASITTPDGSTTTYTYDAFGRRSGVSRDKVSESVEYDDNGRVKASTGADGIRSDISYTKNGQTASVTRRGKIVVEYLYDDQGKLLGEKDPLGRIKKVARDLKGNLLSETAPNGSVTSYEYDATGQRTAQIDGNGNRITFAYDPVGHLIKQVNALGQTLSWSYDGQGRLTSRSNGEQTIKYDFDNTGKTTLLDFGAKKTIAYQYDGKGRLLSAVTPDTSMKYLYDKLGRIEATHLIRGTNGVSGAATNEEILMNYRYDAAGRRIGLMMAQLIPAIPTHGDIAGKAASYEPIQQNDYTYDGAGHLTCIMNNGEPLVTYQYDEAGRPTMKHFASGMTAFLFYDAAGRLSKMSFSGGVLDQGSSVPLDLHYKWDEASQLTSRSWNGKTLAYGYDLSGQLLSVTDTTTKLPLEAYTYDKAGNMKEKDIPGSKTFNGYDAANQLMASSSLMVTSSPSTNNPISTTTYKYDKAGRLSATSSVTPGSPAIVTKRNYGWLDKVVTLTNPSNEIFTYTYWPDGQLAEKKSTSSQESFFWDGLALIRRNDTIYIIEPHPSGGVPIASHPVGKPNELTWFLNDMLGSTLATVDQTGVHFQQMTSFGQPLKLASAAKITAPSTLSTPAVPQIPKAPSLPGRL